MLLWDEKEQAQVIRVAGQVKAYLNKNDFLDTKPISDCNLDARAKCNSGLAASGYQVFVATLDRANQLTAKRAQWVTWIGPFDQKPHSNWPGPPVAQKAGQHDAVS
jgi:hypothetical protein